MNITKILIVISLFIVSILFTFFGPPEIIEIRCDEFQKRETYCFEKFDDLIEKRCDIKRLVPDVEFYVAKDVDTNAEYLIQDMPMDFVSPKLNVSCWVFEDGIYPSMFIFHPCNIESSNYNSCKFARYQVLYGPLILSLLITPFIIMFK